MAFSIPDNVNYSLFAIPAALFLTYVPHAIVLSTIRRNTGKFDNVHPRENIDNLKGKLPEKILNKIKRASGAHRNGIEVFPIFTGAILAANIAGVDNATLNKWTGVFLVSRLVYNFLYIQVESQALSRLRTLTWMAGIATTVKLYIDAAKLKM